MSEMNLDQILATQRTARKEIVDVDEPTVKLVIFSLGDDWFAFHGERIREILASADVFFVPDCPPSLEGVINVRGDIESVIRLNDLLQVPMRQTGESSEILLGRSTVMVSGVRVDKVIDVIDIPQSFMQPPPANLPDQMRPFVSGLLRFKERPVTVLDLEQIFTQYVKGLG